MFDPQAIKLTYADVQLEPLSLTHVEQFHLCGNHDEIWTWITPNPCKTLDSTEQWIKQALADKASGLQLPFVIIDKQSGQMAGSTRYLNIDRANHTIEIGHTFLTPQFWRTHVNSQNKFCLLQHAFEQLGAIRVEFKTHQNNQRSRQAILRLGAQLEGILRHHRIMADLSYRNSAVFSIINHEWPQLKQQLLKRMDK